MRLLLPSIICSFILCLASCTLAPVSDISPAGLHPSKKKPSVKKAISGPLLFGPIARLPLSDIDRARINRIFERTPSFRQAPWKSQLKDTLFIIIPRPPFKHLTLGYICRKAEIVNQGKLAKKPRFITACRKDNGQWLVLQPHQRLR